jgi:hypothetical protein
MGIEADGKCWRAGPAPDLQGYPPLTGWDASGSKMTRCCSEANATLRSSPRQRAGRVLLLPKGEVSGYAGHVSPRAQFILFVMATVGWAFVIAVRTAERDWLLASLALVAGIACALAAWRAAREQRARP